MPKRELVLRAEALLGGEPGHGRVPYGSTREEALALDGTWGRQVNDALYHLQVFVYDSYVRFVRALDARPPAEQNRLVVLEVRLRGQEVDVISGAGGPCLRQLVRELTPLATVIRVARQGDMQEISLEISRGEDQAPSGLDGGGSSDHEDEGNHLVVEFGPAQHGQGAGPAQRQADALHDFQAALRLLAAETARVVLVDDFSLQVVDAVTPGRGFGRGSGVNVDRALRLFFLEAGPGPGE